MKKSYLDANILIAISVGPDKERDQFRMAKGVLNDIKNGVIMGIVSSLVLMEVISVMRKQKGREVSRLGSMSPEEQSKFVLHESGVMYEKLVSELMKLPNLKFELGRHIDLNTVMDVALDILHKIRGRIQSYEKRREDGSRRAAYTAFKGVGPTDVFHALLARDVGCSDLVTFDGGFEELGEFDEFEDLEFRVLKW